MVSLRALALATVSVAALCGAAAAADLLPPPPAEPSGPYPVAETSGWYLRGDVGVGVNNSNSFSTSGAIPAGYGNDYANSNLSESALFDVGVGYQVNNWFRADVTGELRGGSEFSGMQVVNATSVASIPAGGLAQFSDAYRGNVSSAVVLANAYFDLGSWYGVTPYVGGGVGVAFNKFSGGSDTGANNFYNGGFGGSSASGGVLPSNTQTSLAWDLAAGLGFNVTRQLKLELGYRYLNYGSFKSGSARCLSGNIPVGTGSFSCGGASYTLASKNLSSNDFRIGLRYYLDAPTPQYEAPLVRKY